MLPEWARMIDAEVKSTGVPARTLALRSHEVVSKFRVLSPDLTGCSLTESTLSRLRRAGVAPRREKLIVLKLTCRSLEDSAWCCWSREQLQAALLEARTFAQKVLLAAADESQGTDTIGGNPVIAQHERTRFVFGAAGAQLLAELRQRDGTAEAKLAVLHTLKGDGDDARYWMKRATAYPHYTPATTIEGTCAEARRYALEYLKQGDLKRAHVFLQAASDRGDEASTKAIRALSSLITDLAHSVGLTHHD